MGATRGPGTLVARPHPRPREGAPGLPGGPLDAPLRLYLPLALKTLGAKPFFPIPSLYRCHRVKIGAARRRYLGTLSEGGFTSGSFSIAMDASRMCRE